MMTERQDRADCDILVVDDDTTVVMALNKVLSGFGRVRFASNGVQALTMVEQELPDLILMDLDMPVMGGLEACAALKAKPRTAKVPVLIMTSNVEAGFEERLFDAGAADYMVKPLRLRVVAARAQIHLAYHQTLTLLQEQASTDGLTGISNRRRFDEQLALEWKRALREKLPLTVMLADIDQFKKYNDHYGHTEGDACLRGVAQAMQRGIRRPADFLARYGGEEFVVILPDTDAAGAEGVGQALLGHVENLAMRHAPDARRPHVTISIGYSTWVPGDDEVLSSDPVALARAADAALYESKGKLGNCISVVALELATRRKSCT